MEKSKILGAVSIIVLILAIAVFYFLNIEKVYEPKYLLLVLNIVFLSILPLIVAYFAAKSYLEYGGSTLVWIGSGLIVFAICSFVAGIALNFPGQGPNTVVTVHNLGVLLAGICNIIAAFYALNTGKTKKVNKNKLFWVYGFSGIISILITILAFSHNFPLFFIQGQGPTLLRQIVLGFGGVLFAVSSLLFYNIYRKNKSEILYWYFLGLMLITIGIAGIFLQKGVGSPIGWLGRAAQYIAGVYFLIAILKTRS